MTAWECAGDVDRKKTLVAISAHPSTTEQSQKKTAPIGAVFFKAETSYF
jgi:hypothetical protein